jgi:hypothetical protein
METSSIDRSVAAAIRLMVKRAGSATLRLRLGGDAPVQPVAAGDLQPRTIEHGHEPGRPTIGRQGHQQRPGGAPGGRRPGEHLQLVLRHLRRGTRSSVRTMITVAQDTAGQMSPSEVISSRRSDLQPGSALGPSRRQVGDCRKVGALARGVAPVVRSRAVLAGARAPRREGTRLADERAGVHVGARFRGEPLDDVKGEGQMPSAPSLTHRGDPVARPRDGPRPIPGRAAGEAAGARTIYRPPETWARRAYRNLIYFHEVEQGGHFAAWEQPELFSRELRAAFRSLRPAEREAAR